MKRIALLFTRMVLVVGVMVALTPCGFCQKSQVEKTCASACAGDHSCCRHHKVFSVCPIMDQFSESGFVQQPRMDLALAEFSAVSGRNYFLVDQKSSFLLPLWPFHRISLVLRI